VRSTQNVRIAVFGEINMNVIDGSSVWLQSVSQMLASTGVAHVTVLLRAIEERDILTGPLRANPRIETVERVDDRPRRPLLRPDEAADILVELDARTPFDIVLLRGINIAREVFARRALNGRIWLYYVPAHGAIRAEPDLADLARACSRILCQTEEIREMVGAVGAGMDEKLLILPPMIPPLAAEAAPCEASGPIARLLYAGKLSPEYYALESVDLFRKLRAVVPGVELHIAGDKIHNPRDQPDFKPAVEHALASTPGLVWHGAMPRGEVRDLVGDCDVALSLRHPSMTSSAELSTKILEYGSAGRPVLLNRNAIHEQVLGEDYPLFASDLDQALDRLTMASEDPAMRTDAAARCLDAARRHTFDVVASAIAPHLRRSTLSAGRDRANDDSAPHVLLAGHELKFLGRIPERVTVCGGTVRVDTWVKHNVHDEPYSREQLTWANTILCEWCLGNAIFYSNERRDDQRLVVHFHRMELETDYPGKVDMERVDLMVFVAAHVLELAVERFGLPRERLCVVPNAIDVTGLSRPKLPGACFNLGFVGFVPQLKRLDRALDILEQVRAQDDRFRLVVKGRAPWEYAWMLQRERERDYYQELFSRIKRSPLLRDAVVFEGFDPDMASYLQKVGFMLSTSDIEGHAVALAEAMASTTVPVVLARPGARAQYPERWVHETAGEAARGILHMSDLGTTAEEGRQAAALARSYSNEALMPRWEELLGLQSAEAEAA